MSSVFVIASLSIRMSELPLFVACGFGVMMMPFLDVAYRIAGAAATGHSSSRAHYNDVETTTHLKPLLVITHQPSGASAAYAGLQVLLLEQR
jgi:hypothetical protein